MVRMSTETHEGSQNPCRTWKGCSETLVQHTSRFCKNPEQAVPADVRANQLSGSADTLGPFSHSESRASHGRQSKEWVLHSGSVRS